MTDPHMLFVCSEHDDEPAEPEDCMACGTLRCLELLWRSCEVTLDISAVKRKAKEWK